MENFLNNRFLFCRDKEISYGKRKMFFFSISPQLKLARLCTLHSRTIRSSCWVPANFSLVHRYPVYFYHKRLRIYRHDRRVNNTNEVIKLRNKYQRTKLLITYKYNITNYRKLFSFNQMTWQIFICNIISFIIRTHLKCRIN